GTSTFTGPPRAQHTSRSGPASSTSELTGAPCTMSTSCPAAARATSAGSPAYSRSRCSDSVRGGAPVSSAICSAATSTRSPRPASGWAKADAGMYGSPATSTRSGLSPRRIGGGSGIDVGGFEVDRVAAAGLQHELEHRRRVHVVELDRRPDPPAHQDLGTALVPVVLQRLAVFGGVLHAGD